MIPKKCKSCRYYEETLSIYNDQTQKWMKLQPPRIECTMSDDFRFHFNCELYEVYEE